MQTYSSVIKGEDSYWLELGLVVLVILVVIETGCWVSGPLSVIGSIGIGGSVKVVGAFRVGSSV